MKKKKINDQYVATEHQLCVRKNSLECCTVGGYCDFPFWRLSQKIHYSLCVSTENDSVLSPQKIQKASTVVGRGPCNGIPSHMVT